MNIQESVPQGYRVGENFDLHGFYASLALAKADTAGDEKKEEEGKFAYLAGVFSTDTKDLDGEVLDQDGVAEGLKKYFAKLNSQVDWEHAYGKTQDPDALIGECTRFEPRTLKKNGKRHRAHWGVFRLFKKKELAQKVLRHLDAGGKVGASVHGLKLVPTDKGKVDKVMITRISFTPNPVNTDTDIKRYDKFMKALTASSGAPVIPEDLEGDGKAQLYGRAKRLARNFREQGLDTKETQEALASYFDEQLTKGEIAMDDLKEVTAELNKAMEEGEATAAVEPGTEDEKKTLTFLEKTFEKFGYTLKKANAGKGKAEGAEDEDEEEGEEEAFGKSMTFLKGLSREALLKMGKAAGILEKMKGKKEDAMAGYLATHLGKSGTNALVKKYRATKSVDEDLLAEDEKLLKSWEEGTGADEDLDAEIGEEELLGVVSDESYKQLTKSIDGLTRQVKADRNRLDEPMEALGKAVMLLLKKQKDSDGRFLAFCKAVRLPGFDRMPLVASTEKGGDALKKGAGAGTVHGSGEIMERLEKAVVENKLSPAQVAVAKNHARHNVAQPEAIEKVLYPPAATAA